MVAKWNGTIIAKSDNTVVVENNHYFPRESIELEYFKDSDYHTICPWKGEASYFDIEVDGRKNENAAWYYPNTKDAAKEIENMVAFWKGIEVSED